MTRILLCDDESTQRAALHISLRRLTELPLPVGEVREAVHGQQAVELVGSWHPEIVFLDLRMPIMGGLDAAAIIRRLDPTTRLIILTAYDEFDFAQEAIQVGVCDYLLKPASQAELKRVMQKVMAEILAAREQERQLLVMRQRVQAARPLIQQEYISDLLTGGFACEQELEEKRRWLELPGDPELVMVMQLDRFGQLTRGRAEADRQLLKEQVLAIAERLAGGSPNLTYRLGGDRLALILSCQGKRDPEAARHEAMALAERIRGAVNAELQLPLSIGIGRAVDSPLDLHQSLGDAMQAISLQSEIGRNQVIHVDDLGRGIVEDPFLTAEETIVQAMRIGNHQQAMAAVRRLLAQVSRSGERQLSSLRWCQLELLMQLTRAAVFGGARPDQVSEIGLRYLSLLREADSPQVLGQSLLQATEELLMAISCERNLRHQQLVQRALGYLEQHFQRPLTLECMADLVHLSPYYFSHVFKEQTGTTVVQYLTDMRMQEAKRLLRQTDFTVNQLSELVGYNDVNYFSRVFKRLVGLTPSEYRNRLSEVGPD